jgi:hypothetical protein
MTENIADDIDAWMLEAANWEARAKKAEVENTTLRADKATLEGEWDKNTQDLKGWYGVAIEAQKIVLNEILAERDAARAALSAVRAENILLPKELTPELIERLRKCDRVFYNTEDARFYKLYRALALPTAEGE